MIYFRRAAAELGMEPPFHHLTIGMIRSAANKKPRLKLKAAEARHSIPVVARHLKGAL